MPVPRRKPSGATTQGEASLHPSLMFEQDFPRDRWCLPALALVGQGKHEEKTGSQALRVML